MSGRRNGSAFGALTKHLREKMNSRSISLYIRINEISWSALMICSIDLLIYLLFPPILLSATSLEESSNWCQVTYIVYLSGSSPSLENRFWRSSRRLHHPPGQSTDSPVHLVCSSSGLPKKNKRKKNRRVFQLHSSRITKNMT